MEDFTFCNKQKGWTIVASPEDNAIYILNDSAGLDVPWDYFGKMEKEAVKAAVAAHLSDASLNAMELNSAQIVLCQRARNICL